MASSTIRAAAVQMVPTLGAVEANCAAAERLARDAFARGAQWVILPEFFPTGMAFHPSLLDGARPPTGAPHALLVNLAREHRGVVGGSFVASEGERAWNRFVLAFPDGSTFCHDKDLPTMWENCYYEEGHDDGVLATPAGAVGVAMCWELIRSQTARRLAGRVQLVVGGSCWWDFPQSARGREMDTLRERNRELLAAAPGTLARLLGVPLVHASHAGPFEGLTPGDETTAYRSRWLGEAQIVDGRGEILAQRRLEDGEGVVLADLSVAAAPAPGERIPDSFWLPDLPEAFLAVWKLQNEHGRDYYHRVTRPHRRAAASR